MKERPILFSGAMVRAILAGTKTQTRRVVKPQPTGALGALHPVVHGASVDFMTGTEYDVRCGRSVHRIAEARSRFGRPGDRLWVKETFAPMIDGGFVFAAEYTAARLKRKDGHGFWKPSIFMPRVVSRITLEIVRVRVERLQAITDLDAIAEGVPVDDAIYDYRCLWESINGPGSWAENPYVWVIEFRKRPSSPTRPTMNNDCNDIVLEHKLPVLSGVAS